MGADVFYDAESAHSSASDPPPEYEKQENEKDYEKDEDDENTRFLAARPPSPRSQSPLLPPTSPPRPFTKTKRPAIDWEKDKKALCCACIFMILYFIWIISILVYGFKHDWQYANSVTPVVYREAQACALENFKKDLSFLDKAKPIETDEFLQRRDRLAKALDETGVDGFVLEPGYTFQ